MRTEIDPKMLELLDFLFCERHSPIPGECRWGHEIGEIFICVIHEIGTTYVKGYFSRDDEIGYKIHGQLDLLDYIWASGFNKGSKDVKYVH